jgi:Na+/H+ antiporter NhaA
VALAIADDIGTIVVIGAFYTTTAGPAPWRPPLA